MTGSAVLDIALAMAFFYMALSLVCSTLNDAVSYAGGWRANNMTAAVRSLLLNARIDQDGKLVDAVEALFSHALVQTRQRQAKVTDESRWRLVRAGGDVFRALVRNPLRAILLKPPAAAATAGDGQEPTPTTPLDLDALCGTDFTCVLFDLLKPKDWPTGAPVTFADVSRWVERLDGGHAELLKSALEALLGVSDADIDTLRANLAGWYDSAREQARSWYRQRMRTTSVFVGAAMCFALNIDSIEVANRLKRESDLRALVVARGQAMPALIGGQQATPEQKEQARDLLNAFEFGWGPNLNEMASWDKVKAKWDKNACFGIVITTLAISMGAPFWYSIVGRIQQRFLGASGDSKNAPGGSPPR
jgi:hypothetical protein